MDFRNTAIVMTSNLGSQMIQEMSDSDAGNAAEAYTPMKAAVMAVVQGHFRPEFINRLHDIVVFRPLDTAQIKHIAGIPADAREPAGAEDSCRRVRAGRPHRDGC